MERLRWVVPVLLCFGLTQAAAQFPEDALRVSTPGFGVGARALGMGNAYNGISSDYSAIYWNPAGLAQMTLGEFSVGMSYLNTSDEGKFFGTSESYSNNATNFNTVGIAYPVPVRRGSLVLAFGFQRQGSFVSGLEFSGFNPTSSIIQTYAPDGGIYPSDLSNNLAYQLYLANIDTVTGRFVSPIANQLLQSGNVTESGGLNNWSVAGALDIGPNLSAGLTLNYVAGSYRYDRAYSESDRDRIYEVFPFDFNRLDLTEYIEDDLSGVSAKFGILYRVPEKFRIGFTVKTPTALTVKETYGTSATSTFDNGDQYSFSSDAGNDYDIHTPWVIGGGASVILRQLVLSADLEFTDWTTMEFANANSDLLQENLDIKSLFRSTLEYRLGAEYEIPGSGVRLRAGYGLRPSPYKDDPSSYDRKTASAGIGVLLSSNVMLDAAFAHSWWDNYRSNYDLSSRVDESITWNTFMATLSYRF
jgi:long-subunit fatty acid transport protein